MKFYIKNLIIFKNIFYKTALYAAVELNNIDIVQLLLSHPNIIINSFNKIFYLEVYKILNYIIKSNLI